MHRTPWARLFHVSLGLLVLAGCSSVLAPGGWERVVGVIDTGSAFSPAPIRLPDEVRKGVPFTATVVTYGSGSCTRADGADVKTAGLTADITPYDRERTGNVICTGDLRPYSRTVTLRFDAAGEALIRVRGRSLRTDGPEQYETRISVQP
ncbi:MAG: hypothetical protein M3409_01650 [Gemmatimonadota bacterium]|nr:hypothetical protein [Gemmatimonadota bacterium]